MQSPGVWALAEWGVRTDHIGELHPLVRGHIEGMLHGVQHPVTILIPPFIALDDPINRSSREALILHRVLKGHSDRLSSVDPVKRTVDDIPAEVVRFLVSLRIDFPGTDITGIGAAVNILQFLKHGVFLVLDGGLLVADLVLLVAQQARHGGGLIEGAGGIVQSTQGAG